MSPRERLAENMKTAVRARDRASLGAIRLINTVVKQLEMDERTEADGAKIAVIPIKMIKQRKDSARIYAEASRQDLADKENAEMEILYRYLSQMMSTEEIQAAIAAVTTQTGAFGMADMGKVMGVLKISLAGKADTGEVNKILEAILGA